VCSHVAVFVGAAAAPNVRHLLENLGAMLPDTPLDVVTTAPGALGDAIRRYTVYGGSRSPTLQGGTAALEDYLAARTPAAVLQVTRPPIHGTVAGVLAARHGVPFVYRYAGDRFGEWRVARGRKRVTAFALGSVLNRLPVRLARRHVALGPRGRDRLLARGVAPDSVTVLPPAVDAARFVDPPAVDLPVPGNRPVALFVGRLTRLKGRDTFETAIPRVLARRDDLQFVFVGAGDPPRVPERHADHVTAVGAVPPEEIPGYMAAADVLVHPSLTEGVPRVLLEALAAGTPVLARDVGDVASVTGNTFGTDTGFVDRLADLESLPLEDVTPFAREELAPAYRAFARRLTEEL